MDLVKCFSQFLEKGLIPDVLIRWGIRRLLKQKLKDENRDGIELAYERKMQFINKLKSSPIAILPEQANKQHYEVPSEFFSLVLGKFMKYSSGFWAQGQTDFDRSQEDMLAITCERADLHNGDAILELGCGWGSLSLFMAQRYPHSKIMGVSNSRTQKLYIDAQIQRRSLTNLEIITADMNHFQIDKRFDRVVSVEMFEHMRNYQDLLAKISGFLKDDGKLFVHIFTHKEFAYPYVETNDQDWIAKYFFTGGIMPSDDLLLYFQDHFQIHHHWRVSGEHYQKTSEAWLRNMNAHQTQIMTIFEKTYGVQDAVKWWNYWRVFFMACAELWGYRQGTEWMVSHYLFNKR